MLELEIVAEQSPCPKCGSIMVANGKKPIDVRDVNLGHQMMGARIVRKRFLCRSCNALVVQRPPLIDVTHRMTDRLVDYIEKEAALRPYAEVADNLGLDRGTVARIFKDSADAKVGQIGITSPAQMGIDEVRLGDNTCAVIVNLEKKTLVEILPNRSYEAVSEYFSGLPDGQNVKVVAMDAWETYRRAVRATLGCPVVLDKFHSVMQAQQAMEAARKHCRKNARASEIIRLKSDRTLLLSRRENLTFGQQVDLDIMLREFPLLRDCHKLLTDFRSLWESNNRVEAEARLAAWEAAVQGEAEQFYGRARDTTVDWRSEILAYFDLGQTNAITEALNRQIRDVFRSGNGYSIESLRRKVLLRHGQRREKRKFVRPSRSQSYGAPQSFQMGFNMNLSAPSLDDVPTAPSFGLSLDTAAAVLEEDWDIDEAVD